MNYRGTGWNRFFDSQEESRASPPAFLVSCCQQAIPLLEAVELISLFGAVGRHTGS